MIHWLFRGDPAACAPWVGPAKKWARALERRRERNRTYRLDNGVRIRIENYGTMQKVWIEADELCGYQFYGSEGTLQKTVEDPHVPVAGCRWAIGFGCSRS